MPGRFEKKMRVANVELQEAHMVIRNHPAHFVTAYPPRWVNSIYYDTPLLSCYEAHVHGIGRRNKVRSRWYGHLTEALCNPQLEIKAKRGRVVMKQTFDMQTRPWRDLTSITRSDHVHELRDDVPSGVIESIAGMEPVLMNRYFRHYYLSSDGKVRATLDSDMSFYGIRARQIAQCESQRDPVLVLEVKYAHDHAQEGSAVCASFPFPLYKNSKYINGMGFTFGSLPIPH